VAIPHTLGNWRTCCTPPLRWPRSTTRQLPSCRTAIRQLPATATLRPGNFRQPPHCYQATSACDQRTHHYISLPAETNGPFQGPINFTEWIVYQDNDIPQVLIWVKWTDNCNLHYVRNSSWHDTPWNTHSHTRPIQTGAHNTLFLVSLHTTYHFEDFLFPFCSRILLGKCCFASLATVVLTAWSPVLCFL
jgi:hypothetical protein